MRIAFGFDIFYPERNGIITSTINLANNLIDMGHEVYFFVPSDKAFTDTVIEKGIKVIHVKSINTWVYKGIKLLPYFGWYLQKDLYVNKIDIVHTTAPWLVGFALNHAARRLHIPTISTHHTLIDNPIYIKYALKSKTISKIAPVWGALLKPFFKLTWMLTAPGKHTCEVLKTQVKNIDVRYVSNGIDINKFKQPETNEDISSLIPNEFINKNTFIYVGRLGYEKSIDILLQSFAKAVETNSEARLLLIGDGPARKNLERLTEELGITDFVYFAGLVDNSKIIGTKLLSKCLAFATASKSENQAMTVIEAICSSTPTICPNVENMTDLIEDEFGWHFEPDNINDLADKMIYVLEHKDEAQEKGIIAGKHSDRFDGRLVAKQFLALYEELLELKKNNYFAPRGEIKHELYYKIIAEKYKDR